MTPNVKLWRHLYVNLELLNLPIFYTVFKITFQGKLIAEKIFFLYRKYKLRYAIFWIWKHSLGSNGVSPFYNRFYCRVVNTFKVYTTHIYCQKLAEKKKSKREFLTTLNPGKKTWNTIKFHVIIFLEYFFEICVLESKGENLKRHNFGQVWKVFLTKNSKGSFFKEKVWFGGVLLISLKSYNSSTTSYASQYLPQELFHMIQVYLSN